MIGMDMQLFDRFNVFSDGVEVLFSIQIFLACYFEGTNLSDALKP
jgi:hypothetical protein